MSFAISAILVIAIPVCFEIYLKRRAMRAAIARRLRQVSRRAV